MSLERQVRAKVSQKQFFSGDNFFKYYLLRSPLSETPSRTRRPKSGSKPSWGPSSRPVNSTKTLSAMVPFSASSSTSWPQDPSPRSTHPVDSSKWWRTLTSKWKQSCVGCPKLRYCGELCVMPTWKREWVDTCWIRCFDALLFLHFYVFLGSYLMKTVQSQ